MSLLSICQHVADKIQTNQPTVVVGSAGDTERLLLACARETGQDMYRRFNWAVLIKEHEFTTVASQSEYDLPADYKRFDNQTVWDRTNFWEMRGPLSAQQWQAYKSSILGDTVTVRKRYRLRPVSGVLKFAVDPTPASADDLVYEYISKYWVIDSGGTPKEAFTADTDTIIWADDEYVFQKGVEWRMLERLGLAYEEAFNEYEEQLSRMKSQEAGAPILRLHRTEKTVLIGPYNVPDTGYGA